jgi:hypothetical protein
MTKQNLNEEEVKEEILEFDPEQLEELLAGADLESDKLPPFEIAFEDYDVAEFKRGIDEMSYDAGKITALLNAGLSESVVLDYLLSKETIAHNLKVAEINKDIAKHAKVTQEKYEL